MKTSNIIITVLVFILIVYILYVVESKKKSRNAKIEDIMNNKLSNINDDLNCIRNIEEFKNFNKNSFTKLEECSDMIKNLDIKSHTNTDTLNRFINNHRVIETCWVDLKKSIPNKDKTATKILEVNMLFMLDLSSSIIDLLYNKLLLTNKDKDLTNNIYYKFKK